MEADPDRGRVRQEVEPRAARRVACRQRASRSRSRCEAGRVRGTRSRSRISWWSRGRVPRVPLDSRRPFRERWVAAGVAGSAHQAHVGQPGARQSEDGGDARSCQRGCRPRGLRRPFARAPRLDPSRHGGQRRGPHTGLRSFARGTHWKRRRVRYLHRSILNCTRLRWRRHGQQARTEAPAVGDPESRQHGGPSHRPRVHARRAAGETRGRVRTGRGPRSARTHRIPISPRREPRPVSVSSRSSPLTSPCGRSTPTIRVTSGG